MTYCAGWKYGGSVYLLADSAATGSAPPSTAHSNFGELHTEIRGEYVEEALLKIVPLADGIAVAFAGDVSLATKIIDFLMENLQFYGNSLASLLAAATTSLAPFPPDRQVELLLAASSADGGSQLLHWDTVHGLDGGISDYYQIGSMVSYHKQLTPEVLSWLARGNPPADRFLAIAIAVVQSYGIHSNLMEQNIGGLVFGVRTQAGISAWQEDTTFVLYDAGLANPTWVSAFARDDAIVTNSSQTNEVRVLMHSASTPSAQAWTAKWNTYVKTHLESNRYRYWVFLSTQGQVITLIRRKNLDLESKYVRIIKTGENKFDMALSQELVSVLRTPLVDRRDGGLPFRFNVLND